MIIWIPMIVYGNANQYTLDGTPYFVGCDSALASPVSASNHSVLSNNQQHNQQQPVNTGTNFSQTNGTITRITPSVNRTNQFAQWVYNGEGHPPSGAERLWLEGLNYLSGAGNQGGWTQYKSYITEGGLCKYGVTSALALPAETSDAANTQLQARLQANKYTVPEFIGDVDGLAYRISEELQGFPSRILAKDDEREQLKARIETLQLIAASQQYTQTNTTEKATHYKRKRRLRTAGYVFLGLHVLLSLGCCFSSSDSSEPLGEFYAAVMAAILLMSIWIPLLVSGYATVYVQDLKIPASWDNTTEAWTSIATLVEEYVVLENEINAAVLAAMASNFTKSLDSNAVVDILSTRNTSKSVCRCVSLKEAQAANILSSGFEVEDNWLIKGPGVAMWILLSGVFWALFLFLSGGDGAMSILLSLLIVVLIFGIPFYTAFAKEDGRVASLTAEFTGSAAGSAFWDGIATSDFDVGSATGSSNGTNTSEPAPYGWVFAAANMSNVSSTLLPGFESRAYNSAANTYYPGCDAEHQCQHWVHSLSTDDTPYPYPFPQTGRSVSALLWSMAPIWLAVTVVGEEEYQAYTVSDTAADGRRCAYGVTSALAGYAESCTSASHQLDERLETEMIDEESALGSGDWLVIAKQNEIQAAVASGFGYTELAALTNELAALKADSTRLNNDRTIDYNIETMCTCRCTSLEEAKVANLQARTLAGGLAIEYGAVGLWVVLFILVSVCVFRKFNHKVMEFERMSWKKYFVLLALIAICGIPLFVFIGGEADGIRAEWFRNSEAGQLFWDGMIGCNSTEYVRDNANYKMPMKEYEELSDSGSGSSGSESGSGVETTTQSTSSSGSMIMHNFTNDGTSSAILSSWERMRLGVLISFGVLIGVLILHKNGFVQEKAAERAAAKRAAQKDADDRDAAMKKAEQEKAAHLAYGRKHPLTVKTLTGDTHTLLEWGACWDLREELTRVVPALGASDDFTLSDEIKCLKPVDCKYGSAFRVEQLTGAAEHVLLLTYLPQNKPTGASDATTINTTPFPLAAPAVPRAPVAPRAAMGMSTPATAPPAVPSAQHPPPPPTGGKPQLAVPRPSPRPSPRPFPTNSPKPSPRLIRSPLPPPPPRSTSKLGNPTAAVPFWMHPQMDLVAHPEKLEQLFEPYQQEGSFCAVAYNMGSDGETNYLLSVRKWDQNDRIMIVVQYLVRMFHDDDSVELQLDGQQVHLLDGVHTLHEVAHYLCRVHAWWPIPLSVPIPHIDQHAAALQRAVAARQRVEEDKARQLKAAADKAVAEAAALQRVEAMQRVEEEARQLKAAAVQAKVVLRVDNGLVQWECNIDGAWIAYAQDATVALESAYSAGESIVEFNYAASGQSEQPYRVTNLLMQYGDATQTNRNTGVERVVRRLEMRLAPKQTFSIVRQSSADDAWISPEIDLGNGAFLRRMKMPDEEGQAECTHDNEAIKNCMAQVIRMTRNTINDSHVQRVDCITNNPQNVRDRYDAFKAQLQRANAGALPKVEWVFHGTPKLEYAESIVKDGFRIGGVDGHPVSNGKVWGQGVYSDVNPSTPAAYGKFVVLCKALPGKRADVGRSERNVNDPRPGYDSWVPKEEEPTWRIFRSKDQLLPCYIIHVK
jgi:hypothetical protein